MTDPSLFFWLYSIFQFALGGAFLWLIHSHRAERALARQRRVHRAQSRLLKSIYKSALTRQRSTLETIHAHELEKVRRRAVEHCIAWARALGRP